MLRLIGDSLIMLLTNTLKKNKMTTITNIQEWIGMFKSVLNLKNSEVHVICVLYKGLQENNWILNKEVRKGLSEFYSTAVINNYISNLKKKKVFIKKGKHIELTPVFRNQSEVHFKLSI